MHDSNIIFLHGWLFDRRIWCHLDKFFKNNFSLFFNFNKGVEVNCIYTLNIITKEKSKLHN